MAHSLTAYKKKKAPPPTKSANPNSQNIFRTPQSFESYHITKP
jgi:hypothetical protein